MNFLQKSVGVFLNRYPNNFIEAGLQTDSSNPYMKYVARNGAGRRFVIADIHGCYKTFKALLHKIDLQKEDQLFLLGDYIDKGPNSSGVLNTILALQKNDFQVYPIRGNHEELLLNHQALLSQDDFNQLNLNWVLEKNGTADLLGPHGNIRKRYLELIHEMPYFIELDDFLLVHAGFNFEAKKPFFDTQNMLWMRNFETPSEKVTKTIIHGDSNSDYYAICDKIENGSKIIPLDNNCLENGSDDRFGSLLALNLDTMELTSQENVEL
ncbi:metallophosphoesterase family protein [Flexithrix dorotheae]|uniref:metallophosphoesterase family protein n=1 Tax=Flexithrix dorotheae TaxID=70993 RepID=UPI00036123DA|nr:metallophosphoesterase family protein [Flexithrix dorotheae]